MALKDAYDQVEELHREIVQTNEAKSVILEMVCARLCVLLYCSLYRLLAASSYLLLLLYFWVLSSLFLYIGW